MFAANIGIWPLYSRNLALEHHNRKCNRRPVQVHRPIVMHIKTGEKLDVVTQHAGLVSICRILVLHSAMLVLKLRNKSDVRGFVFMEMNDSDIVASNGVGDHGAMPCSIKVPGARPASAMRNQPLLRFRGILRGIDCQRRLTGYCGSCASSGSAAFAAASGILHQRKGITMKNLRTILVALSALAFVHVAQAQSPAAPDSAAPAGATQSAAPSPNAPYSADPLVQKRQADAVAKSQYKARKKAAKKKMKAEQKAAKNEMKSEKSEAKEIRNEAMAPAPASK
jgi:hypothetical protein